MIKRFAYIVLLLIFAPCLLVAHTIKSKPYVLSFLHYRLTNIPLKEMLVDTTSKKSKQQQEDEKKKIKEISKAKRQSKPEKIDAPGETAIKAKPKRERRPEGLERPPEIPRRNGN
jgi:hypothetical protein